MTLKGCVLQDGHAFSKNHKSRIEDLLIFGFFAILALNFERLLGIANANPVEKAFLVSLVFILLIKGEVKVGAALSLVFVISVVLVSAALTKYHFFEWERFLRSLFSLIAVWMLICVKPSKNSLRVFLIALAVFPAADVVLGLFYAILGISGLFGRDYTGAMRLAGTIGPAYLGAAAYAGAVAAAFLGLRRPVWILVLGVNVMIAMLTASRSATAAAVLSSGAVLWFYSDNAKSRVKLLVFGLLGLTGIFALYGEQLIHRLSTNTLSGRERIWTDLMYSVDQYPFFGVGLGHQVDVFSERLQRLTKTTAAHNEYLRFLVETGYVGLGAILIAFFAALGSWIKEYSGKAVFSIASVSVVYMAYGFTDNTFSVVYCFFGLVAGLYGVAFIESEFGDDN